jgi:hypothetical protein
MSCRISLYPTTGCCGERALPAVGAALGAPYRGSLRIYRERPMRAALLPARVPWVGGRQCLRVLLGDRTAMDLLPLPSVGACVAKIET